ncbi:MAG: AAA family ATPase [Candidatus Helarchaeota archaeon]
MKVEIKNIGGLIGVHDFNFDKGLSIIHAPNGTGKSSLLKALHLIIGNTKIPEPILKNYLSEKEISGYVKVNLNGNDYEVQLQRKGDKVLISYSNVDDLAFPSPTEELAYVHAISDLYQGILKNDFNFITSWYHRITEDYKYELIYEIASNVLSEYKAKRDELKRKLSKDISDNQDKINELKNQIEDLNNSIERILNSESYQKSMEAHKEKKEQINNLRKKIEMLNKKKETLTIKIINQETELDKVKKQLEKLQLKIENFDAEYPIKKAQFDRYEQERDNLEKKLDMIKHERLEKEEKLNYEKVLLSDYKKLLKRETCPTCHQKLDNIIIKDFVSKGEHKVQKLTKNIELIKQKEKDLLKSKMSIDEELIKLKNFLKIEIEKLRKEKNIYEKTVNQLLESLPRIKKEKLNLIEKIENENSKLLEIQKELAKENPYQEELFKLQGEKNSKEKLLRKLEEEIEESSEYQRDYLKYERIIKKAEIIQKYFENRVIHLKRETFNRINKALLNSFELLELAKLKKIEFSEKDGQLNLEIVRDNNIYTSLEKLSGAEKSLITLIISWVVKQMVIPNEPIFLIDEITTEMDDTRFKDILNYISEKIDYLIVARHKPYEGKKQIITSKNIISTFV